MDYTIWDAIIQTNTPKVEKIADFMGAVSDDAKVFVDVILSLILNSYTGKNIETLAETDVDTLKTRMETLAFSALEAYRQKLFGTSANSNSDKAKERVEIFHFLKQDSSNLFALDIMNIFCPVLLAFPSFTMYPETSCISSGMLIAGEDIIDNNPLEDGLVYEILYPNLFSVLLLEAIGQRTGPDAFLTLAKLKSIYGGNDEALSPEQKIKPFLLPEGLRELFAIERKSGRKNSPYQIGTNFPELLYGILKKISTSPLREGLKTANSLSYLKSFYDECVKAISPTEVWSERSFAEFYLFERIFRLNAKFTLASFDCDSKGEYTLSPELLRDFFFHSPLAIFPSGFLGLFYTKTIEHPVRQVAKQSLHFLIQLSAYWFPCILSVMRTYMQDHEIRSPNDICKFFFPEPDRFESFRKDIAQALETPSSYKRLFPEDSYAERRVRDDFSEKWSIFRPSPSYCAEAYAPLLLSDWKDILYQNYPDLVDSETAKSIFFTINHWRKWKEE